MAVEITRTVTSDVSGKKGAERKGFTLDGTRYAIDVTTKEWNDFLASESVATFLTFARQLSSKGEDTGEAEAKDHNEEIRDWARANGYDVADRGAIARKVKAAYAEAHEETTQDA